MNFCIFTIERLRSRRLATNNTTTPPSRGETTMETWRKVWREGVAPQLSQAGLEALRQALASDDSRLLQGATTAPPPLQCVQDWPVEAACVIVFCGWQGDGLETVADVEECFARVCFE